MKMRLKLLFTVCNEQGWGPEVPSKDSLADGTPSVLVDMYPTMGTAPHGTLLVLHRSEAAG